MKPVTAPRTFSLSCRPSPPRLRPRNDLKNLLRTSPNASGRLRLIRTFWSNHRWQGADVEDLVRVQLAHFADLVSSRIAVRGPKMRLNATAAQAIGLAVHELATNAGKYGALSTDAGRVDVSWQLDGDTYTMGWIERNGPPVSHRAAGASAARPSSRWRSALSAVRLSLIALPQVSSGS